MTNKPQKKNDPFYISEKDKYKEIRRWFQIEEILWIDPKEQREVILNPGRKQEIFRKTYPIQGQIVLHKQVYIDDLPHNCKGRIIAVTALQPKDRDRNPKGPIKAKPISKHWELFETYSRSWREWVNPSEYRNLNTPKKKRKKEHYVRAGKNKGKNQRIHKDFKYVPTRIGDVKINQQILRELKSRNFEKDDKTSGAKGEGRNTSKSN